MKCVKCSRTANYGEHCFQHAPQEVIDNINLARRLEYTALHVYNSVPDDVNYPAGKATRMILMNSTETTTSFLKEHYGNIRGIVHFMNKELVQ